MFFNFDSPKKDSFQHRATKPLLPQTDLTVAKYPEPLSQRFDAEADHHCGATLNLSGQYLTEGQWVEMIEAAHRKAELN